jgi:hypothetical protein
MFRSLLPADRDEMLAGEVLAVALDSAGMPGRLLRLERRLEQVTRALSRCQGPPSPLFALLHPPRASDAANEAKEARLLQLSATALGQPFKSARYVAQAMKRGRPAVKPVEGWNWSKQAGLGGFKPPPFLLDDLDLSGEVKALRYGLRHRVQPTPDFESFARLFAAGFAQRDASKEAPGDEASVLASESQPPVCDPDLGAAAQAAWARLECYGRHAEELRQALREILESKPRLESKPGPGPGIGRGRGERTRVLAARLKLLLSRWGQALDQADGLEARLRGEFYNLFTRRHGSDARWEFLNPAAQDDDEVELDADRDLDADKELPFAASQKQADYASWRADKPPPPPRDDGDP